MLYSLKQKMSTITANSLIVNNNFKIIYILFILYLSFNIYLQFMSTPIPTRNASVNILELITCTLLLLPNNNCFNKFKFMLHYLFIMHYNLIVKKSY